MKSFIVGFVFTWFLICGCSASERSAYRDCVRTIGETQLIATVEESATCDTRECVEQIARQRAIIAADYVEACVASKDGGRD